MAGHLTQMTLAVDMTPDLGLLSSAAVALRTRLALSQQEAQEAEERAAHAMGLAGGLGKVRWAQWTLGCQGPLWNSVKWGLGSDWAMVG